MNIIQDIEDIFLVDEEFSTIYNNIVDLGEKHAQKNNVAILSLARNISSRCKYNLRKLRLISELFAKSQVCIYENDSIDGTPELINEIIAQPAYGNFKIYSEKIGTKSMPLSKSTTRTTNMANARNKCYTMIEDVSSVDYIIIIDLDFIDFSIKGLMNSFGWLSTNPSISAICGNSYIEIKNKKSSQYHNYDSFAFRLNYWNEINPLYWFPLFNLPIGSCPISVFSGFGGCCIYRKQFYEPLYSGEDCEHVMLHKNLKNKYDNFKLFYNPSQIALMD